MCVYVYILIQWEKIRHVSRKYDLNPSDDICRLAVSGCWCSVISGIKHYSIVSRSSQSMKLVKLFCPISPLRFLLRSQKYEN